MLVGCIDAASGCAITRMMLNVDCWGVLLQAKQPGAQGQRRKVSKGAMGGSRGNPIALNLLTARHGNQQLQG
jgi:hypothetical protein